MPTASAQNAIGHSVDDGTSTSQSVEARLKALHLRRGENVSGGSKSEKRSGLKVLIRSFPLRGLIDNGCKAGRLLGLTQQPDRKSLVQLTQASRRHMFRKVARASACAAVITGTTLSFQFVQHHVRIPSVQTVTVCERIRNQVGVLNRHWQRPKGERTPGMAGERI